MKKIFALLATIAFLAPNLAMAGTPRTAAEYTLTKTGKTIVLTAALVPGEATTNWARLKVVNDVADLSSHKGWELGQIEAGNKIIGRLNAGVSIIQLRSTSFRQDIFMAGGSAAIAAIVDGLEKVWSENN